jgi:hypothetical protein
MIKIIVAIRVLFEDFSLINGSALIQSQIKKVIIIVTIAQAIT